LDEISRAGDFAATGTKDGDFHKNYFPPPNFLSLSEKTARNTELGSSVNPQPGWLRYRGSARFQRAGSGGILPPVPHFQALKESPTNVLPAACRQNHSNHFPAAARSASTSAFAETILPAGIETSPARNRRSISTFSAPVTTHKIFRDRLINGYVSVIRRRCW
jgi:hypothetical protein